MQTMLAALQEVFVSADDTTEFEIRFGSGNRTYTRCWNQRVFETIVESMQACARMDEHVLEQQWRQHRDTITIDGIRTRAFFDTENCKLTTECCRKVCTHSQLVGLSGVQCLVVRSEERPEPFPCCIHSHSIQRSALSLRKSFLLSFPDKDGKMTLDFTMSYYGKLTKECTQKMDSDQSWDCLSIELEVLLMGGLTCEFIERLCAHMCSFFNQCADSVVSGEGDSDH
jgi:hypothetical protein